MLINILILIHIFISIFIHIITTYTYTYKHTATYIFFLKSHLMLFTHKLVFAILYTHTYMYTA